MKLLVRQLAGVQYLIRYVVSLQVERRLPLSRANAYEKTYYLVSLGFCFKPIYLTPGLAYLKRNARLHKMSKSKILDNKQLIHIASEVVVLTGLTFYFSSKNRTLMGHIEELAQRLEEQEDHIQKLEQALNNLGKMVQTRVIPMLQQPVQDIPVQAKPPQPKQRKARNRSTTRSSAPHPQQRRAPLPPPPVSEPSPVSVVEELSEDNEDSDLDDEIRQELEELEEIEEIEEEEEEPHTNLKKQ